MIERCPRSISAPCLNRLLATDYCFLAICSRLNYSALINVILRHSTLAVSPNRQAQRDGVLLVRLAACRSGIQKTLVSDSQRRGMKGSKRFLLGGVGVIVCALLMSACGGKTPQNGAPALNISAANPLPSGAEGDAYKEGLLATGGVQPYTWTIDSGALPPGLTLTTDGVLSGTPPTGSAGTYSFTVRVTDSQSPVKAYQIANLSLTINPPLSFPVSTLTNAVIAVPYSATITASGGLTPYTYKVINDPGCLFTTTPNCASNGGLTLTTDTADTNATISGTPTGPIGTYMFTVQVTDSYPTTATAVLSITITGKIQGNYAFSFNGYNSAGQAFYMAGSFVADGNGNITGGVFD